MQIQKKLYWLKEYIELVRQIIPEVDRITLVREIHHQEGKVQQIHASLTQEFFFGTYVLSFYTSYKRTNKSKKKKEKHEYSKIDLLGHLAHEMAHLKYWTHTPEHKMLECKLTVIFMRHLLKSGYVSEEEEIIERRKNR
jgi:hypothetical protein